MVLNGKDLVTWSQVKLIALLKKSKGTCLSGMIYEDAATRYQTKKKGTSRQQFTLILGFLDPRHMSNGSLVFVNFPVCNTLLYQPVWTKTLDRTVIDFS